MPRNRLKIEPIDASAGSTGDGVVAPDVDTGERTRGRGGIVGRTRDRQKAFDTDEPVKAPVKEPAPVTTAAQPVVDQVTAPEPDPADIRPDAATETVEGRLASLTEGGSAYIETAKQDAIQSANTRGLINSTIAAGAGTGAAIRAALPIAQQDAETAASFTKNVQSAELNKQLAEFENNLTMEREEFVAELKTRMQTVLDNNIFSNETKASYINTISTITSDAQQQIVDVGMSDRSASQQAAAIALIETNRDASIKVYEDLLNGTTDLDWGTGSYTQPAAPGTSVSGYNEESFTNSIKAINGYGNNDSDISNRTQSVNYYISQAQKIMKQYEDAGATPEELTRMGQIIRAGVA